MLRSLVGSEMCIRDRQNLRKSASVPHSGLIARLPISPERNYLLIEKWKVCLLYTSDAADDLLCVDLGGRRIIKKKKYYNLLTH